MKYFAYISSTYVSKNKLGEQLSEEIKKFDKALLKDDSELHEYVSSIEGLIEMANEDNPRCTPDRLGIHDYRRDIMRDGSMNIYPNINRVFYISIYPVKLEWDSSMPDSLMEKEVGDE